VVWTALTMTGILPKWLADLTGVDVSTSGEGTTWSLKHAWFIPPWLSFVLGLGIVLLVIWCYRREGGTAGRISRTLLSLCRLTSIAILVFMLAQFLLALERTGLPYVAVLIDDSASMRITDAFDSAAMKDKLRELLASAKLEGATRLNLAKSVLLQGDAAVLNTIDQRYKLKLYYVSDAARMQSGELPTLVDNLRQLEPTGENSRLGLAIRTVLSDLRGTPPSAIVLLSDGVTTDGETLGDVARLAKNKGVPLFTIAVGSETPVRDLEVNDLLVDEVVFVDDIVNFEFQLSQSGYAGRDVTVTLKQKGLSASLAQRRITLNPDGKPQKVILPHRPTQVGDFEFIVEVEPLEGELQTDNNRQSRIVGVRKEQVRVLYVQGYPNFEFRYLKHMLQRDSTISLRTVLQEADAEYTAIDQTALSLFPVRREELFEYDVVILGDADPALLSSSALANLSAFVTEKGGGVIFVSGELYNPTAYRDTALAALMPVDLNSAPRRLTADASPTGYRVRPTELGQSLAPFQLGPTTAESSEIWRKLPPLFGLYDATNLKPAARVLAERDAGDGRNSPVVVMQYVGAGKVIFHAMDDSWRWRFRVGDVFFARYWIQTIRFLARSKLLGKERSAELTVDRREYRQGESVRLRTRFLDERIAPPEDDGVVVIVEQEGQANRKVTLSRQSSNRGVFEGVLTRPAEGRYHAWISAPVFEGGARPVDFRVVAPPGEFERTEIDAADLRRAASETKGKYYTLADANTLLSDLPSGRQVPIEALPPIVLWNQWPLLAILLGSLVTEWAFRKRVGML
jgi:hypothetical protein